MNIVQYAKRFMISGIVSALTFSSLSADANTTRFRMVPEIACRQTLTCARSTCYDCPLATGNELWAPYITAATVDGYTTTTDTSVTWEAKTCRLSYSGQTATCSTFNSHSQSTSGANTLTPSVSTFTGGSSYDYRYYHVEMDQTWQINGTYTTDSSP